MFVKMDAYNISVLIVFLLLFIYAIRSANKEKNKMDNTNIGSKPLKLVKMRTIKDSHWFETLIDEDLFIPKKETKTEIYGLYGKTQVAIKKENK